MTDLNTLIPPGFPLFLQEALGINDRRQIVGYGLQTATGEVHAYLAAPCEEEDSNGDDCGEDVGRTIADRQSPSVVLPDNVRKLLQQRRRITFPGFGAPRD